MAEQQRQAALDAMNILDTPPDERIDRITRLAKELFDVPMVAVNLIDRDRQWTKSGIGLGGKEVPRDESFCQHTVDLDVPFVVEDLTANAVLADYPAVMDDPGLRFYAGHPVHAPNGQPIGALCVLDTKPRGFGDDQRALLRDLAHWVETELGREEQVSEIDAARLIAESTPVPEVPGYTVAADATAHVSLSGDFYDLQRRCRTLRFTLVDAMGHGIGAALIAAGVRASIHTDPSRTLAQTMADADRVIADEFGGFGIFATGVYGDLDLDTGALEIVDAGHGLAFILCADGSWTPLRSKGLPLGIGTGKVAEREPIRATLAPGDTFICCSDGLLDVLDPDDPFGQVARTIRKLGPHGAVALVADLAQDERAIDDITAIVVQRDA